jgi:hypothetical protein
MAWLRGTMVGRSVVGGMFIPIEREAKKIMFAWSIK